MNRLYSTLDFLFPSLTWKIKTESKVLYLTFDDGPVEKITPWVLEQLDIYNAKATFFCIGDNVRKNPAIYAGILASGHLTGNHTYNHLNAFITPAKKYIENIASAQKLINSKLFRPPYGKITPSLINKIKSDYNIIMWNVLSRDYDTGLSGKSCADIVLNETVNGSIIVFHDSIKAAERMQYALPVVLKHFSDAGYRFETLPT
jgi:peptidoglycan-N-acetylglucosamine deacetylase